MHMLIEAGDTNTYFQDIVTSEVPDQPVYMYSPIKIFPVRNLIIPAPWKPLDTDSDYNKQDCVYQYS